MLAHVGGLSVYHAPMSGDARSLNSLCCSVDSGQALSRPGPGGFTHEGPRSPVATLGRRTCVVCALLIGLAMLATGCAGVRPADSPVLEPVPARGVLESAPPPHWQADEGALESPDVSPDVSPDMSPNLSPNTSPNTSPNMSSAGTDPVDAPPGSGQVLFADPEAPPVLFSQDPELLRAEVASECLSASTMNARNPLGDLVTALYLSMVDPGEGTDALIQGKCASVEEIVRTMVTTGGEQALPAVVKRAREASPPGARRKIDIAAATGLARQAELNGDSSGPTRLARDYAMAYFPSAGPVVRVDAEARPEPLYRGATPDYGLYTFVMVGPGFEGLAPVEQARSRELFRLVEMYGGDKGDPNAPQVPQQTHVFLIPVDAELGQSSLFNQVAANLSDRMRVDLIKDLRAQGQSDLAGRLEKGSGPFLISGVEPTLVPEGQTSFRLLADLSGIGIEHLYDVVDAFDRQLSPQVAGRPESLTEIRDRLNDIPQSGAGGAGRSWVFLLGGGRDPGASAPARPSVIGVAALLQNRQPGA